MRETGHTDITIVIDVFRAFTTACYILQQKPAQYYLTNQCTVVNRLADCDAKAILVGKPEINSTVRYHIPNSPQHAKSLCMTNKTIIHRTQAGATGILRAFGKRENQTHRVFACSLVNADATISILDDLNVRTVNFLPMGHEAAYPSMEDNLCAEYFIARRQSKSYNIQQYFQLLKDTSGKYFFSDDQWQYPIEDFDLCLRLAQFDFAIEAIDCGDYAKLVPVYTKFPSL